MSMSPVSPRVKILGGGRVVENSLQNRYKALEARLDQQRRSVWYGQNRRVFLEGTLAPAPRVSNAYFDRGIWKPPLKSKTLLNVFQDLVTKTHVSVVTRDRGAEKKVPVFLEVREVVKVQQPNQFRKYQAKKEEIKRELARMGEQGMSPPRPRQRAGSAVVGEAKGWKNYGRRLQSADGIRTHKAMPQWTAIKVATSNEQGKIRPGGSAGKYVVSTSSATSSDSEQEKKDSLNPFRRSLRKSRSSSRKSSSQEESKIRQQFLFTKEPIDPTGCNEFYLWHGTTPEAAEAITSSEFQLDRGSEKALFGKGLYFAESSTKSDEYEIPFALVPRIMPHDPISPHHCPRPRCRIVLVVCCWTTCAVL